MEELKIDENMEFMSGDGTPVSIDEVIARISAYYLKKPEYQYTLSIGTDSMTYEDTRFVLAIVMYRTGNGGIYFYHRFEHPLIRDLRSKLYEETRLSIAATELLINKLMEQDQELFEKLHLSIHLDIGKKGPTRALISELEGWITSLGYDCQIKPESYAASSIADMYSK